MSFSEILKLHKSILSGCRGPYIHKLTNEGRADGRTDKHDVSRAITFNRSCNVLKVKPSGKNSIRCQKYAKTRRPYQTQTLFQFSASPSPILGTTENATFAHFMKKSMHLKTGFLLDYQVLYSCF